MCSTQQQQSSARTSMCRVRRPGRNKLVSSRSVRRLLSTDAIKARWRQRRLNVTYSISIIPKRRPTIIRHAIAIIGETARRGVFAAVVGITPFVAAAAVGMASYRPLVTTIRAKVALCQCLLFVLSPHTITDTHDSSTQLNSRWSVILHTLVTQSYGRSIVTSSSRHWRITGRRQAMVNKGHGNVGVYVCYAEPTVKWQSEH